MGCKGRGAGGSVGMLGMPGDAGGEVRVLPEVPEVPRRRSGCSWGARGAGVPGAAPGAEPRTRRCPVQVVLKGRAGGGAGCFFLGRLGMAPPGLAQGSAGTENP